MLRLKQISKSFPGVQALSQVDFEVEAGEIHALVGENGAGKSTLTKIIAGAYQPDAGHIELDGAAVRWDSPADAKRRGIHVIYQELILFPELSVAENIFIGNERRRASGAIDYRRTLAEANEILKRLGAGLDPRLRVGELSVNQQMVEIARALVQNVKLLVLDEPTAVISSREVEQLFKRLRALRSEGVAIVYISHRLDEVFELSDRVTVLKDGALIGTQATAAVTRDRLISMMVGRDLAHLFPPKRPVKPDRPTVLRANNLTIVGRVADASIELRAGEIVGLAGLVGAGRSELAFGIFGALPIASGTITVGDTEHTSMTPARAIALGIGLVTEDRKAQGLAMLLDVAANVSASSLAEFTSYGLLARRQERAVAHKAIREYGIACRGPRTDVATMSGGNQQKVIVARWARTCRSVLILDEPTRGVDIGAKQEIYRIMHVMISSELPEIVGMADRAVVMREGRIVGEVSGDAISEEVILGMATRDVPAAAWDVAMKALANILPGGTAGWRVTRSALLPVIALIVVLMIIGVSVSDRFGTTRNLWNVYEQSTGLALVSLGQTLVILTGGIDLSVGSMISLLSELISGSIDGDGAPVLPVLAGVIVLGALLGAINGACIVLLRVHPLIVTLGTGAALQGLTLLYSSHPPGKVPDGFDEIAYGRLFDVPMGASVAVLLVLLTALFLRFAPFGRYIFAVGGDESAARLMGLPRDRVIIFVYAFSGFCCALTAIFLVARFGVGQPYAGYNFTLGSITPVVIGGTWLAGGKGGVLGTLLGVYLIGLIYNVLNYVGIPTNWQLVVQGLVVILAVSVYVEKRKAIQ